MLGLQWFRWRTAVPAAVVFVAMNAAGWPPQSLSELRQTLIQSGLTAESFDLMLDEAAELKYDKDAVAIADLTLSSNTKRFFVYNLKTYDYKIFYVAHGVNSGGEYAQHFSNVYGSLMSSLGFFRTSAHNGRFGPSFSLTGLSPSNSNASKRTILIHGAEFASTNFSHQFGFLGRSEGCLSVSYDDIDSILNRLGVDALVLSYQKDAWKQTEDSPDTQDVPNAMTAPGPLPWEVEENDNGQNDGRSIGYYRQKYGGSGNDHDPLN